MNMLQYKGISSSKKKSNITVPYLVVINDILKVEIPFGSVCSGHKSNVPIQYIVEPTDIFVCSKVVSEGFNKS
jgi:hypothetical protein